ncbi:MAG: hypothetical protein BWK73_38805 [Thiothrix lacustris]|uniref:Uncharacterized protein n=1 Tax=Thiothrix lacustris TaxID=525917 RepID=A0A1Y1QEH3_9GAMM|nr:MAG: hypothetical protein BWK73_38805 [Thiothrix lacustris]
MTNSQKTTVPANWDTVNCKLNVNDVAAITRGSVASVWRWAKLGTIPQPRKIGGSTRWDSLELKAALDAAEGISDDTRTRASKIAKGVKVGKASKAA